MATSVQIRTAEICVGARSSPEHGVTNRPILGVWRPGGAKIECISGGADHPDRSADAAIPVRASAKDRAFGLRG